MKNRWTTLKEHVNGEIGGSRVDVVVALPFERWAAPPSDDAIRLDSCRRFETIVVRTRHSVYELIVLSGDEGDVLLRGGRAFPGFRRARLAGSSAGGSALSWRTLDVGRHMELHLDGEHFVTSTIQALSRIDAPHDATEADG